jgi:MYXO-CTERM domain-containing protein
VATADGYVSIVDSRPDSNGVVIVYLDDACEVTRTQGYPTSPRDPEDLAVAPDGALWVADIGDNATASSRRSTIALWRIPPGGGSPLIHRLTYPDGPHDAEALLFGSDGSPIVITKELGDTSYVYTATRALEPSTPAGVPMSLVGEFHPAATLPADDLGRLGELLVTGAATAPDRSRVAIRTYTAAYEWDVPDGDVAKAITQGTPRVTPLDDEPQGEALAYTVDGQAFLTVSDETGPTTIRRYQPVGPTPTAGEETPTAIGTVTAGSPGTLPRYAVTIVTVALLLAVLWLVAHRRRREDDDQP